MAQAVEISPFTDEKIYTSIFAGKRARMSLAVNPGSLGISSTTAAWDAVELSGNGYARSEWTIPNGTYNSTTGRFEAPTKLCEFSASSGGQGLQWNSAYIVLGTISNNVTTWDTGIFGLITEASSVIILPGATPQSYELNYFTNGFQVTS